MTIFRFSTPLDNDLIVVIEGDEVRSSSWSDACDTGVAVPRLKRGTLAAEVRAQMKSYAAKRLDIFRLPLAFVGTDFELAVWRTTATIPLGCTVSYGDVARVAGHPGAHRAVARAMSTSAFALFVPAHRVVGSDGRVKGAGADSTRMRLLAFEDAAFRH